MNEITILDKIRNQICLCEQEGRNPISILMNSDIQKAIMDEVEWIDFADETMISAPSLFGLSLITCNVKDFLIIDDRHWYEQKF